MRRIGTIFILMLFVVGCGRTTVRVAGVVSADGAPVESGNIAFDPGNGPVVGGPITNGEYNVPNAPLGKVVVRITALRTSGTERDPMSGRQIPKVVRLTPPRYNNAIKIEITGPQTNLDFNLSNQDPPS